MKSSREYRELLERAFNMLLQTSRMASLPYESHVEREKAAEVLKGYIETSEVVEPKEGV